jgi:5'-3' exonuclease
MTSKEKAKELVDKFKPHSHFWVHDLGRQKDYEIEQLENAKQCALIAVDLAIEYNDFHIEFLQEVKQEIEKL